MRIRNRYRTILYKQLLSARQETIRNLVAFIDTVRIIVKNRQGELEHRLADHNKELDSLKSTYELAYTNAESDKKKSQLKKEYNNTCNQKKREFDDKDISKQWLILVAFTKELNTYNVDRSNTGYFAGTELDSLEYVSSKLYRNLKTPGIVGSMPELEILRINIKTSIEKEENIKNSDFCYLVASLFAIAVASMALGIALAVIHSNPILLTICMGIYLGPALAMVDFVFLNSTLFNTRYIVAEDLDNHTFVNNSDELMSGTDKGSSFMST